MAEALESAEKEKTHAKGATFERQRRKLLGGLGGAPPPPPPKKKKFN